MSWLNKLEKISAPIALPGLIRYVAFLSTAAFIVGYAVPEWRALLPLEREAFFGGQFWRLLTFAFIPSSFSLFWIFALMLLFMMGDALEQTMGATRLTLFYGIGWCATVAVTLLLGGVGTPLYLNLSLLLAFATLFPDTPLSLFMIFPVKVKWIAIFSLAAAIVSSRSRLDLAALIVGLGNYLLFFSADLARALRTRHQIARRQQDFREKSRPDEDTLHCCKVCRRTELSGPELEFRVASDGEEYCLEHLPKKAAADQA